MHWDIRIVGYQAVSLLVLKEFSDIEFFFVFHVFTQILFIFTTVLHNILKNCQQIILLKPFYTSFWLFTNMFFIKWIRIKRYLTRNIPILKRLIDKITAIHNACKGIQIRLFLWKLRIIPYSPPWETRLAQRILRLLFFLVDENFSRSFLGEMMGVKFFWF